ncbi:MAG: hypothetical protein QMC81_05085 [Thermoanaerobacterales bacterium]|nr:hypothetical protein [Thermoanaerobacterales bacterium]
MERYRQVIRDHRARLLRLPNVVGVGLGYKRLRGEETREPAIVVFVAEKVPEGGLPRAWRVPRRINGLPTDVVYIGRVRLLAEQVARMRPAQPGVSIGHYQISAGTFGALVYDARSGAPLILSNNHVLANQSNGRDGRAREGDPILQPGPYDGGIEGRDTIARLERFAPLHYSAEQATCPAAARFESVVNSLIRTYRPSYFVKVYKEMAVPNMIDAAVARPVDDGAVTDEILGLGRVKGVATPELGASVRKSGRTSGLTGGVITYVDATVAVQLGENRLAVFEDQIMMGPMSQPGDSGSLIVDDQMRAVGLLFAGSTETTIANRIDNVTRLLGITFGAPKEEV